MGSNGSLCVNDTRQRTADSVPAFNSDDSSSNLDEEQKD